MTRSHPPSLLKLSERALRERCGVTKTSRILAGVSGGPDSTAMLHVLALLSRRLGFYLAACGVDHGLRPEADRELEGAATLAASFDVPFHIARLSVAAGSNLQARARAARRDALEHFARAEGCDLIATGHHADDRAETLLIRLLRGAGPRGLSVLPPREGQWIRPLIEARRADVLRHLDRHDLVFSSDPSNDDRRFLRVAVRKDLLPLMEAMSPGVVGHLNVLSDQLNQESPPTVFDSEGHPVPLGRSHVAQIKRALRAGTRDALVKLPGGRAVRVAGRTGRLDVVKDPPIRRQKST